MKTGNDAHRTKAEARVILFKIYLAHFDQNSLEDFSSPQMYNDDISFSSDIYLTGALWDIERKGCFIRQRVRQ